VNSAVLEQPDLELAHQIAEFYDDMLGAALFLFPWGQGPLADFKGPNKHQERFLIDLSDEIRARKFDGRHAVRPIRMTISSGHGTGKTACLGMLAHILMSTRPGLLGTVTANTGQQLATKTWAAIQTWSRRAINKHWFEINAERFYRIGRKSDWFMSPQTCAEENSEAFAGQHNVTSSSVYIFDEASNIPDKIWEVAEGGLTDGEAFFFAYGNCTRRNGTFFDINFGQRRDFWLRSSLANPEAGQRVWNSEDSEITNKEQLEEWALEHGRDSDFYRVRVLGEAPSAGDSQFISARLVMEAQKRMPAALPDDPLIAGCDLAWGGQDKNCVRFRKGSDARSIPPIHIPGELTRDASVMVLRLSEVLTREWNGQKVAMLFIDSAGIAGPVARRLRELGHRNIIEVNFGAQSPDSKYENMRAYMWGKMRDALASTAIDKSLDLEADLQAPAYKLTKHTKILLESKQDIQKRLGRSTDDADALALTWAMPVASEQAKKERRVRRESAEVTAWS
jgi:hypothetical protein